MILVIKIKVFYEKKTKKKQKTDWESQSWISFLLLPHQIAFLDDKGNINIRG